MQILLSGGYDCSLRFYTFDDEDWTAAQAIPNAHDETIWFFGLINSIKIYSRSAAFEPTTGQHLATIGGDRCIKIWTRKNQEELDEREQCSWSVFRINLISLYSNFNRRPWHKTVDLSLEEETRWPLYTVAWSSTAPGGLLDGNDEHKGILAVGGGDQMIRFFRNKINILFCRLFLYDAKNEALIRLDKIRMDAEVSLETILILLNFRLTHSTGDLYQNRKNRYKMSMRNPWKMS